MAFVENALPIPNQIPEPGRHKAIVGEQPATEYHTDNVFEAVLGTDSLDNIEQQHDTPSFLQLGRAALKGAVVGPFRQIKEIGQEVRQAHQDYRSVKELYKDSGYRTKHRLGFIGMKAWYAAPMPLYQVADDAVTYPLYLHIHDQMNTGTAYGIAAGATLGLAAAMGFGQRAVEKNKAEMVGVETTPDDSDNVPLLLDSTVNSAPWQVARKANEPREEGEPIKLVRHARIIQYAAAYATVNTVLYTAAEKMPMNEWAGFGTMLWGAWALGGAYREVKGELNVPEQNEVEVKEAIL